MTTTTAASTTATSTRHCTECRRKTVHRETRLDSVCTACCWRTAKAWRVL